jgi:D-alanyl-D-alanine carboxypeptidase (penicillin-binding protein 5/6)
MASRAETRQGGLYDGQAESRRHRRIRLRSGLAADHQPAIRLRSSLAADHQPAIRLRSGLAAGHQQTIRLRSSQTAVRQPWIRLRAGLVLACLLCFRTLGAADSDAVARSGMLRWPGIPAPPMVDALSVAIVDAARGEVLYARDADRPIPPASLTKLMTMRVALQAIDQGRISLSDIVTIRREEVTLPYGSSLMYLQAGMRVPFDDLLRGMAVISGNDAAMAVARTLGGSTDGFAAMMNTESRRMGLAVTRFVEPSGLSEHNITTAAEMAAFARLYLTEHPETLTEYHGRTSMEFPRAEVMPAGVQTPAERIILRNRNNLVLTYTGCDGLKTGFIRESGYNQIVTAERDGSRFIVVTMGGTSIAGRIAAGKDLLDWAFANWRTIDPPLPALPEVRIWGGAVQYLQLTATDSGPFTVPGMLSAAVRTRIEAPVEIDAPVAAGQKLGSLVFLSGDRVLRRIELTAAQDVPLGNILIRLRDTVVRFFRQVTQRWQSARAQAQPA